MFPVDGKRLQTAFNFGSQGGWSYHKEFGFEIAYHFGISMENLNRIMNLLEVATYDHKEAQFANSILQADALTMTANKTPA